MFSKADFELVARVLGLPVPETPAEQAAATPVVAEVLRKIGRGEGPPPGMDDQGRMYTGATHSLNGYPDNNDPMEDARLASRMRTEPIDFNDDEFILGLMETLDPQQCPMILAILRQLMEQAQEHTDALSSQRPMEYDTPNLGGNYSALNAPASNGIEPSRAFQPLS